MDRYYTTNLARYKGITIYRVGTTRGDVYRYNREAKGFIYIGVDNLEQLKRIYGIKDENMKEITKEQIPSILVMEELVE